MDQDTNAQNEPRPSVINWVGKTLCSNKDSNKASDIDQSFVQNRVSRKGAGLSVESSAVEETAADFIPNKVSSSQLNMTIRKEKYNCRFCGKPFQWNSHWQAHERIHTGDRPYKCDECDKAFTRSDGLQCHKLTHVSRECSSTLSLANTKYTANSFQYKHCDERKEEDKNKTSSCSSSHAQHLQGQKDKKVSQCATCDKVFSKQSALEIHSRVHTGTKPYHCNICTKSFSIYGNLKRHLLIHTGERPYTCSTCSRSFNNQSHLKRHIKAMHTMSSSTT